MELDPSPAAALRVDITPLKRAPGVRRPLQIVVESLEGIALPSVDVESTLVEVDLQLEMTGDKVVAVGDLAVHWIGPCRRCLDPIADRIQIAVQEIFEKNPVEGETYPLEDEFADLRPMVRESLVLSLPVAPLCGNDCVGPAPDVFPTGPPEQDPADSGPVAGDPRWAALDQLSFASDSEAGAADAEVAEPGAGDEA